MQWTDARKGNKEISLAKGVTKKDPVERRKYWNAWYAKNKARVKGHYVRKSKRRKRNVQQWYNEHKKTLQCLHCGESHPACIDFHHSDPSSKKDHVGRMVGAGSSVVHIQEELKKCIPLCSNCHRKLHYNEKNGATAI